MYFSLDAHPEIKTLNVFYPLLACWKQSPLGLEFVKRSGLIQNAPESFKLTKLWFDFQFHCISDVLSMKSFESLFGNQLRILTWKNFKLYFLVHTYVCQATSTVKAMTIQVFSQILGQIGTWGCFRTWLKSKHNYHYRIEGPRLQPKYGDSKVRLNFCAQCIMS